MLFQPAAPKDKVEHFVCMAMVLFGEGKIKQTRANYFLSRRAWAMLMLRPSHRCSYGGVE